jgi:hypothetical protein
MAYFFRYNGFKRTKDGIIITLEPWCFLIRFEALFSIPVVQLFIIGIRLGTLELVRAAHAHEFAWPLNFWLVCPVGFSGYYIIIFLLYTHFCPEMTVVGSTRTWYNATLVPDKRRRNSWRWQAKCISRLRCFVQDFRYMRSGWLD